MRPLPLVDIVVVVEEGRTGEVDDVAILLLFLSTIEEAGFGTFFLWALFLLLVDVDVLDMLVRQLSGEAKNCIMRLLRVSTR